MNFLNLAFSKRILSIGIQEIFLLAFKSIRRFRRGSKFSSWLYQIGLNHCLTRLKKRPPGIHYSIEDQTDVMGPAPQLRVPETQVSQLLRLEQRNRVLTALAHLPQELQQAAMVLHG
jgi:RNA polymerase sigma-70 factor (ECF subfamily)